MSEKGLEVMVTFPDGIATEFQGHALLHMEMLLRKSTGLDVRVVKALKGDDSKLRKFMTIEQRDRL